jgi:hypothetical protein
MRSVSAAALERMRAALQSSPMTAMEAAERLGVSKPHARNCLRHLREGEEKQVYVCDWRFHTSQSSPVYALGNLPDVPRPRFSKIEHWKRYRDRVRADPERYAKRLAAERARNEKRHSDPDERQRRQKMARINYQIRKLRDPEKHAAVLARAREHQRQRRAAPEFKELRRQRDKERYAKRQARARFDPEFKHQLEMKKAARRIRPRVDLYAWALHKKPQTEGATQ